MSEDRRFLCAALAALLLTPAAAWPDDARGADPGKPPAAAPSFRLSGGIYLFEYLPQLAGAEEKLEIYAFLLDFDAATADGRYGLHVETRARDSKLRSYYASDVWFQEAYAWAKTAAGDLHVGKVYRRVGIFWDDSFFGNVHYFNGLKLNPDYGAELVGQRRAGDDVRLDYSLQYFVNNDRVAGSLPGRDVESDDDATLRNTVTGRLAPTWSFGDGGSLTLGVSGLSGRVDRTAGTDFRLRQLALEATLAWGPSISYVEWLHQDGERFDAVHPLSRPGYDDADYWLLGTRWQVHPRVNLRLNASRADYVGQQAQEVEVVPGLVARIDDPLSLIVEYDWWKLHPDRGTDSFIDKSFSLVLHYTF